MSSNLRLESIEKALPLVLIANVPVWLLGALAAGMALEYDHWSADTYIALILFTYLPVAVVAGILGNVLGVSDRLRMAFNWALVLWGALTIAVAAVWIIWMVISVGAT